MRTCTFDLYQSGVGPQQQNLGASGPNDEKRIPKIVLLDDLFAFLKFQRNTGLQGGSQVLRVVFGVAEYVQPRKKCGHFVFYLVLIEPLHALQPLVCRAPETRAVKW